MSEKFHKHKLQVLLVDDNAIFLKTAISFLRHYNYLAVVGAAMDGEQALVKARELAPDVVLVDLLMPGMHGIQLLPLLRAALPGARLIALTLAESDNYRKAALRAGADAFVRKDLMARDLIPVILEAAAPAPGARVAPAAPSSEADRPSAISPSHPDEVRT